MLGQIIGDQWRLLSFRRPSAAISAHWQQYLLFGTLCTWLAGMGRYWDNPKATLFQNLGFGSLVYAVFLSGLISPRSFRCAC